MCEVGLPPVTFTMPTGGVRLMVHGDDFVIIARQAGRQKVLNLLSDHFELKHDTAGPGPDMAKQIRILGSVLTCTDEGWTLEADPNLIENAVCRLGMEDAKGLHPQESNEIVNNIAISELGAAIQFY